MSTEIRLAWQCPHYIREEPVALSDDRRSLIPRSPVAGAGSVRILANDSIYIPSTGLDAPAKLVGGVGPYRIRQCQDLIGVTGNQITITTSTGSVTVSLPTGTRIPLSRVLSAFRLNAAANNLVEVGSDNSALYIQDRNEVGTSSYVRVSGTGADSLGFVQRGTRGKNVYPGWDLIAQQDVYPSLQQLGLQPKRYPRFRAKLQNNPDLKVSYTAPPERCARCGATWVENDWRFDPAGEVIRIQNEDLLYQACLKAILTVQGSNPFYPSYGSKLITRLNRKLASATASLVRGDVQNALQRVQALQNQQRRYQSVTSREQLFQIQNVDVTPSAEDPTVYYVEVVVRNGSNQPVSLTTVFTVPGAVALGGSNGQPLGIQGVGLTGTNSLFGR